MYTYPVLRGSNMKSGLNLGFYRLAFAADGLSQPLVQSRGDWSLRSSSSPSGSRSSSLGIEQVSQCPHPLKPIHLLRKGHWGKQIHQPEAAKQHGQENQERHKLKRGSDSTVCFKKPKHLRDSKMSFPSF
uniref:Uncharacterized protein LOC110209408 isoform X2 n=1 Tax=Phascolarctos cinereus TaxID=38626 RepID=A0A6P5KFX1_PHACI|nr:uncharacterized protein LOC110209408 isoform X2 [Phascolarctos cinereus]